MITARLRGGIWGCAVLFLGGAAGFGQEGSKVDPGSATPAARPADAAGEKPVPSSQESAPSTPNSPDSRSNSVSSAPSGEAGKEATDVVDPSQRRGRITADAVYVRSGASQNHYPVTKLNAGDVVVIVEEQEEWYGVEPPKGAFSLVSQEYVDTTDGVHGVINGNRVNVRAGSHFSDDRYQVQVQLSRGAEISILAKTDDGYYRIVPPPGAVMYVSRKFVTPLRPGEPETPTVTPQPLTGAAPTGKTAPDAAAPANLAPAPATAPAPSSGDDAMLLASGATPLRQKLVELNAALKREMSQPLAVRELDGLLEEYRLIAAQDEDAFAKQYAAARAAQLEYQTRLSASAANLHVLSSEIERGRSEFLAARQRTAPPLTPPRQGFDAEGELRTSAVYSSAVGPKRYRLVAPNLTPARTIGYVELSANLSLDIDRYLGRYVGIKALRTRPAEGMVNPVPVYTASSIELLEP
ncbi:MAG: SH3 domain-containing protein [Phycisphaerae bacterium]|nr:MAG: hypothetical protein EDS66_09040 [Planctomycetota bacterium]KAB2945065.1 MAG: SH3 domain-containing protein [Phycisphaerae bacterium]MBE7455506.1 SH3 domain-containing protein [Planctomycetia bacterium]MCK6464869.1 SH3 domain-containing protein [Phycisphaerae bacterium]MCL4719728.1 SH3 domain-containing protein [Phycisphaerae bacterium]